MPSTFENRSFNRFSLLSSFPDDLSSDEQSSVPSSPSPTSADFNSPHKYVDSYGPKTLVSPFAYNHDEYVDNPKLFKNDAKVIYSDDITPAFLVSIGACHCFHVATGEEVDDSAQDDSQSSYLTLSDSDEESDSEQIVSDEWSTDNEQDIIDSVSLAYYGSEGFYSSFSLNEDDLYICSAPTSSPVLSHFQESVNMSRPAFSTSAYPDSDIEDEDEQPRFVRPVPLITAQMEFEDINTSFECPLPVITQRLEFADAPLPPITPRMDIKLHTSSNSLRSGPLHENVGHMHGGGVDPDSESDGDVFYTPFQSPFTINNMAQRLNTPHSIRGPETPSLRRVRFEAKPRIFSAIPSSVYDRSGHSPKPIEKLSGTYSIPNIRSRVSPLLRQRYLNSSTRQKFDDEYDSDVEEIIDQIERATGLYRDHMVVVESDNQHSKKVLGKVRTAGSVVNGGMIIVLLALVFGFMFLV